MHTHTHARTHAHAHAHTHKREKHDAGRGGFYADDGAMKAVEV